MRLVPFFSFLLFFLFLFSVNVDAQQKIAYVDFQDIYENYPSTQEARDSFEHYKKQLDDEYEAEEKALQDRIEELERRYQGGCMSLTELKAGIEEIKQKNIALEKMLAENKEKVLQKEQALLSPIRKKIKDIINQIALEYDYDYIIDTTEGFIYKNEENAKDITQKVRKKLEM